MRQEYEIVDLRDGSKHGRGYDKKGLRQIAKTMGICFVVRSIYGAGLID